MEFGSQISSTRKSPSEILSDSLGVVCFVQSQAQNYRSEMTMMNVQLFENDSETCKISERLFPIDLKNMNSNNKLQQTATFPFHQHRERIDPHPTYLIDQCSSTGGLKDVTRLRGNSTLPTNYSSCMTKLEDHLHPPDVYSYIPLVYPNVLTKIDQHTVKMSVQAEGPSAGGGGGSGGGGDILQHGASHKLTIDPHPSVGYTGTSFLKFFKSGES
eukprot:TRINITY_DN322_c1_g1_i1.p1 TRINITY_DN322_c1_g1~~TRINITY_DN322_c1_g1_i1.p1  ORF type:complete len:215 (+),score=27.33 TRINITY_DN322_c1_g1_i1:300-944(+)